MGVHTMAATLLDIEDVIASQTMHLKCTEVPLKLPVQFIRDT